jgi:hypothetical protein
VNGQPVITWRPVVSRRFDATAKRFLTPEQIDACMVETESRPFRRTSSSDPGRRQQPPLQPGAAQPARPCPCGDCRKVLPVNGLAQ